MARYINLDALLEIIDEDLKSGDERVSIAWLKRWLLLQSKIIIPDSADMPEVVRCKECMYFREENSYCMNPHCGKSFYGTPVRESHFCSFGEREE